MTPSAESAQTRGSLRRPGSGSGGKPSGQQGGWMVPRLSVPPFPPCPRAVGTPTGRSLFYRSTILARNTSSAGKRPPHRARVAPCRAAPKQKGPRGLNARASCGLFRCRGCGRPPAWTIPKGQGRSCSPSFTGKQPSRCPSCYRFRPCSAGPASLQTRTLGMRPTAAPSTITAGVRTGGNWPAAAVASGNAA
jgi:hypothetical protein